MTNVVGAPPMYVAWSMLPDVGERLRRPCAWRCPARRRCPRAVLQRVLDATGHHVFEGYGLTETAPVLTSTLMSEVAKPGSIGRPVPGVELRLLDEGGAPVEEGDPGEVVVRGANLFPGYWPDGADGPDADGWFATGDVALRRRRRRPAPGRPAPELVLVSGFNVYPREVEDVLLTHPEVAEAAVLGIPHPYTGESVKALVVRDAGRRGSTAEDVIAHCAPLAGPLQVPDRGRVRRRAAARRDRQGQQGPAARAGALSRALAPGRPPAAPSRRRSSPARAATCATQAEPVVARAAADAGRSPLEVRDVDADPADRAALRATRCRSCCSTASSTRYWQVDERVAARGAARASGAVRRLTDFVHAFTSA